MKIINKFFHYLLGWGFPQKGTCDYSVYSTYCCEFCKNKVTQDVTGTWVHLLSEGNIISTQSQLSSSERE